jgi:predicted ATP-binding protein involved in virulence
MKLSVRRSYKSITSLPIIDLPDFVVLTGLNGTGKSHLLEAIENGSVQIDNIALVSGSKPIRRFDWTNLIPQDTGTVTPSQIAQEKYELWSEISQYINQSRAQLSDRLRQIDYPDLANFTLLELSNLISEIKVTTDIPTQRARHLIDSISYALSSANKDVYDKFVQKDPANRSRILGAIQDKINAPLIGLEEDDFYGYFPLSWQPIDMFQQSLGRLFVDYRRNWIRNQLKTLASSKGESVKFLTDEEFLNSFGIAPWVLINNILETAKLDFRISEPPKYEDHPYEPILIDQVRGSQVKFSDLSSGEKILMAFALCLYYAEDARQIVNYPKVLLFDEIDAPLHPSMTQSILRTIQEVLIKQHHIKVILATHSPSTVALSTEESLYVMNKVESRRIEKTTRDKALAILTTGVPTLSINYENRRQVFVESKHDVDFYEKIYEKLRDKLTPEISINFISSGKDGQGNCDQVKDIVNNLARYGNRSVYGIIDWDTKNNGNEFVKVLGKGRRYSIENYIFDPILLVAFLLREKFIGRNEVGLDENHRYTDFSNFENVKLQSIADLIVKQIREKVDDPHDEDLQEIDYVGGKKIRLPLWFLRIQGHDLETIIKQLFPPLNKYQREGNLKREIINKVIDDIPDFISKDVLTILSEIQNV